MSKISNNQLQAQQEATVLMQEHAKPCWCPQIAPFNSNSNTNTNSDPNILTSKYFGNPWLAEGEAWPMINDLPAIFILQLEIKTLPEPVSKLLGGEGYLQFFYSSEHDYDPGNDSVLRIVKPEGAGAQLSQPEVDYHEDMSQKVITGWTQHTELPHGENYTSEMEEALDEIAEKHDTYIDDLVDYPHQGDKLGGWAFWTQGDETPGDDAVLVYQIDAGCFFDGKAFPAHAPSLFAGDGTGHIFVSKNNPNDLCFYWACT